jgi:WD repeat and SOF domain-containing protein 1
MKVKVINRSEEEFCRDRNQDLRKVHRNLDPALHPFEKAVEYKRAETAAKLDRYVGKSLQAIFRTFSLQ